MTYQTMGERIRQLRQNNGYTQEQVASMAGISQPAYSRYEADKVTRFIPPHIEAIAKALNTTKEYLTETQDRLDHHTEEIQKWLETPASVEYVLDAYIKYLKEKR